MSARIISLLPPLPSETREKGQINLTRREKCIAVRIRYKTPFVDWLNTSISTKQEPHSLDTANEHGVVLLLDADSRSRGYAISDDLKYELFFFVLRYWATDSKKWIQPVDMKTFDAHFELETSPVVIES